MRKGLSRERIPILREYLETEQYADEKYMILFLRDGTGLTVYMEEQRL